MFINYVHVSCGRGIPDTGYEKVKIRKHNAPEIEMKYMFKIPPAFTVTNSMVRIPMYYEFA